MRLPNYYYLLLYTAAVYTFFTRGIHSVPVTKSPADDSTLLGLHVVVLSYTLLPTLLLLLLL